jgi:hypothetical protein
MGGLFLSCVSSEKKEMKKEFSFHVEASRQAVVAVVVIALALRFSPRDPSQRVSGDTINWHRSLKENAATQQVEKESSFV